MFSVLFYTFATFHEEQVFKESSCIEHSNKPPLRERRDYFSLTDGHRLTFLGSLSNDKSEMH